MIIQLIGGTAIRPQDIRAVYSISENDPFAATARVQFRIVLDGVAQHIAVSVPAEERSKLEEHRERIISLWEMSDK